MRGIIRVADNFANALGLLSGFLMLLTVAMIVLEIILRKVFNSTLYITEEYTGYFLVAVTFLSLAYTLKEKGHIRITVITNIIKSKKVQVYLDIITAVVSIVVLAILTYLTFNFFLDSVKQGSQSLQVSRTYLAIPQFVIPMGSFILLLQFISELCKSVIKVKEEV